MKTYEIRYREPGKECCPNRMTPFRKIRVRAASEEQACEQLKKKLPSIEIGAVKEV